MEKLRHLKLLINLFRRPDGNCAEASKDVPGSICLAAPEAHKGAEPNSSIGLCDQAVEVVHVGCNVTLLYRGLVGIDRILLRITV